MSNQSLNTGCCVVGGGPAGMMLGYLLAREGVRVTVLEKYKDFFRDFRGDTVHPSTLELLHELGLLDDFLKIPHQEVTFVNAVFGDFTFQATDFRHLPTRCKFVVLMPQWDFLNFLSERARRFPSFELRLEHEGTDLIHDGRRVVGVQARGPGGSPLSISADLVVGCDGRHSTMRQAANLELVESGVPIDVLWFRISRLPDDPKQLLGAVNYGKALILLDRGTYFQAGLIIRKGGFDQIKQSGLDRFRANIAQLAPYLEDRVHELKDWDQIKLLTVQINRLKRWHRPGLLCIGDAAHAMSPAGGVGINLAVQDAVAAANRLAAPLRKGAVPEEALAAVQRRREFPARATQAIQVQAHKALAYAFSHPGPLKAPLGLKIAVRIPGIHRALGYTVGIGVRPEHVRGVKRRSRAVAVGAAIGAAAGLAIAIVLRSRLNSNRPARHAALADARSDVCV